MTRDIRTELPPDRAQAILPAPDPLSDPSTVLLQGALAEAWAPAPVAGGLRDRLVQRATGSAAKMGSMVNVRQHERVQVEQRAGCSIQRIYGRDHAAELRAGEPLQLRTIELAPRAVWLVPEGKPGVGRDWLVMRGEARLQTEGEPTLMLKPLDYHVQGEAASSAAACVQAGVEGATLLLRERALGSRQGVEGLASQVSQTSREAPHAWEDYAPLIKRRVLWQEGPMAAMLWLASPGAVVPQHHHGHDEECLMLRGDLFQDDYLLREGDYQLAPGGSSHETVNTDTGALIYAHGDLEMQVQAQAGGNKPAPAKSRRPARRAGG